MIDKTHLEESKSKPEFEAVPNFCHASWKKKKNVQGGGGTFSEAPWCDYGRLFGFELSQQQGAISSKMMLWNNAQPGSIV